MTVPRPLSRRLRAPLAALLAGTALALGVAGPAGAHGGEAVIAVEGVHPAGQSVHYVVRVTWADDGHAAIGATVTATAVAADGTTLTPVPLAPADDDGRYSGAVEYPTAGAWTVRITSIEPTGTIEQPQQVAATTTVPPSASAGGGTEVTTGDGTEGGFAPADDGTGADEPAGADASPGGDPSDDGGFPVVLVVAAALVAAVGAVTAANIVRRARTARPAGHGDAGDGGGGHGPEGGHGAAAAGPDPAGTPTETAP